MNSILRKTLFSILSILVGLLICLALVGSIEYFFRLNKEYEWLQPLQQSFYKESSRVYLPPEIDISYIKTLKPYEGVQDYLTPDNYDDTYKFKDCKQSALKLNPFWQAVPSCNARMVLKKRVSNRVVYDVHYNYNEHGLRIIPSADSKNETFLLFLGCSYTLGEGVEGIDNFANRLTQKLSPINAFNLGMVAYGPREINRLLRNDKDNDIRLQAVKGNKGIAIYTFIDDHVARALNTLGWNRGFGSAKYSPYYYLKDHRLVLDDIYVNASPIRTKLFDILVQSEFLNFFRFDWPIIGNEELTFFAAIIADMKINLEKNYNIKKFIFAVFPNQPRYISRLKPFLEKEGIEVFDFSNTNYWDLFHERFLLFGNGHPSPEAHRFYADLLEYEIKKRGFLSYLK